MADMRPGKVRAIAICAIRSGDKLFVFEGRDSVKGETFYRPLGGTIEFGEYSAQTVMRELYEEIDAEITNLLYLGALENIFTHEDMPWHEIIMVYQGDFADTAMYNREVVMGREDDGGQFKALWMPVEEFSSGKYPLYPTGLLELLLSG
jgi:8-oxo-dGTP pyrophosphatase MutT (NUDIX family)